MLKLRIVSVAWFSSVPLHDLIQGISNAVVCATASESKDGDVVGT